MQETDTTLLNGYQIYHNYIREHEGLNGKTPAEACRINIKGNNKWRTSIQNASYVPIVNLGRMRQRVNRTKRYKI